MGENGSDPSAAGRAIVADGSTLFTPQEKAELFLNRFCRIYHKDIANKSYLKTTIDCKIATHSNDPLNDPFTPEEIDKAILKPKSKAEGNDRIQNKMIRNLSTANRRHLGDLFNAVLPNAYVPEQWKKAVVIPLLKQGKPAEDPNSCRPVSLTSCLGITFERLMANRLHWFLESKGIINTAQTGFRRGCSTTDHIAQLDSDIKTS